MSSDNTKTCSKCKETKPVDQFPTNKTRNGTIYLRGMCRECKRIQDRNYTNTQRDLAVQVQSNKNWRDNNRDYYNAFQRAYLQEKQGNPVPFVKRRPGVDTRPEYRK